MCSEQNFSNLKLINASSFIHVGIPVHVHVNISLYDVLEKKFSFSPFCQNNLGFHLLLLRNLLLSSLWILTSCFYLSLTTPCFGSSTCLNTWMKEMWKKPEVWQSKPWKLYHLGRIILLSSGLIWTLAQY